MFRQKAIPKEIKEKIKEESKPKIKTMYNSFEHVADNVLLVFKHQTATLKAFGTLYKLSSVSIEGSDDKEETYALYTENGNWLIFRKRLHKYHDLKSELDDRKLIELKPDITKVPLVLAIVLSVIYNALVTYAIYARIDLIELLGQLGVFGLAGWVLTIALLFGIVYQRQFLLRGWKGAFFIDLEELDTISVIEPKFIDLKLIRIRKGEEVKTLKTKVYRISMLYTEKANAKELRGFSLQEVADEVDEELKSRAELLKKERDALLLKIKELTIENEKLRRENDELAGKNAVMYSMGAADASITVLNVEKKQANIEMWQNIIKWTLFAITFVLSIYFISTAGVTVTTGGVIAGGIFSIILILILIIVVVNAVRRF